jgi:hypothetical protein
VSWYFSQDYILAGADTFVVSVSGPASVDSPLVWRQQYVGAPTYYYAEFVPYLAGQYAITSTLLNADITTATRVGEV